MGSSIGFQVSGGRCQYRGVECRGEENSNYSPYHVSSISSCIVPIELVKIPIISSNNLIRSRITSSANSWLHSFVASTTLTSRIPRAMSEKIEHTLSGLSLP